jgi:hypothetical protein
LQADAKLAAEAKGALDDASLSSSEFDAHVDKGLHVGVLLEHALADERLAVVNLAARQACMSARNGRTNGGHTHPVHGSFLALVLEDSQSLKESRLRMSTS